MLGLLSVRKTEVRLRRDRGGVGESKRDTTQLARTGRCCFVVTENKRDPEKAASKTSNNILRGQINVLNALIPFLEDLSLSPITH